MENPKRKKLIGNDGTILMRNPNNEKNNNNNSTHCELIIFR